MVVNDRRAWMVLRLLSRANEEIAALGGTPGAPLDTQESWTPALNARAWSKAKVLLQA